jgi:glutathione synthase/RimK-type ligase-like ATP-grasp enzyme
VRIAFVTTDDPHVLEEDVDRPLHDAAFKRAGVALEHPFWWDTAVRWDEFDLIVLRSPWDYSERITEFRAWLDSVAPLGTLENAAAIVRWNLDKHYLLDFGAFGVPTVPTIFAKSVDEVAAAAAAHGTREVVVKPAVSAGSRNTGRFSANDPGVFDLAEVILREGQEVIVEPFVRSVAERGEASLVFFDGDLSHGFRKGPILEKGGGFVGGRYRELVTPCVPTAAEVAVARAAGGYVQSRFAPVDLHREDEPLLYARYDIVTADDGEPLLLEAELCEPSFFLESCPGSAERFAKAVIRRADIATERQPESRDP